MNVIILRARNKWTSIEIEMLVELYPHHATKEVADKLARSERSVYQKAYEMGLKKSPEYIATMQPGYIVKGSHTGASTRFVKGQQSWNKGVKGLTCRNKTSFEKGNRPHNSVPVGTEIVTEDGYIKVKVSEPKGWAFKHRLVWIAANGPIPAGHIVVMKDRNKQNTSLDNLQLISRRANLDNNSINRFPEDLKSAIRAVRSLTKAINKYGTKKQN